ncbi:MAG: MliC family protein [Patescibacteria group bacterium]
MKIDSKHLLSLTAVVLAVLAITAVVVYALTADRQTVRKAVAAIAGEPPIPSGKLQLTFSGGRQIVLPQTISADGARYANTDESLVFWDKGDEATFYQAGQTADICKINRN